MAESESSHPSDWFFCLFPPPFSIDFARLFIIIIIIIIDCAHLPLLLPDFSSFAKISFHFPPPAPLPPPPPRPIQLLFLPV